jgi:hypothetical protein
MGMDNDNNDPNYTWPPYDKYVSVYDAKTKTEVVAKRTKHKLLGDIFVKRPEPGGNWQIIVEQPRAWKDLDE